RRRFILVTQRRSVTVALMSARATPHRGKWDSTCVSRQVAPRVALAYVHPPSGRVCISSSRSLLGSLARHPLIPPPERMGADAAPTPGRPGILNPVQKHPPELGRNADGVPPSIPASQRGPARRLAQADGERAATGGRERSGSPA